MLSSAFAMRLVPSVLVLAALAACSSSSQEQFFDPGAQQGNDPGTGFDDTEPKEDASISSSDSGNGNGNKDSGGSSNDSGTTGPTDGGTITLTDGGIAECATASWEKEPNDQTSRADTLSSSICGEVSGQDVDYVGFTLSPKAKSIRLNYGATGPVIFKLEVKGQTITWQTGEAPNIPYQAGAEYMIEIKAVGSSGPTQKRIYRLVLIAPE